MRYHSRMEPTAFTHFRSFRSSVQELWPHLTRPELLQGWLGTTELELRPQGDLSLKTWSGDMFRGRVISAVPPVRLEIAWRLFDFEPESHVVWKLSGDGPGGRLTVTHDHLRSREERDHARLFWRESLDALHRLADERTPSPEWGATHPVTVRLLIERTAADLWPLISTGPGLSKWVANVEQFDAQPGGTFRFRSRYRGQDVIEQGTIQEIVPESRIKLSWDWIGEGWGAPTDVLFALDSEPGGSSLLIAHSGFDRLDPNRGGEARRNYAMAWPEVLGDLRRLVAPVAAR